MMMEDVGNTSEPLIVCPTEAELQAEPTVNVPCIVDGCNKIFNTSAARSIHVIQTHKIYKDEDERKRFSRSQQKSMSKVIKHFYCPVKFCNRSIEWKKPFSRLSLLKQHYYILHAEKKYPCQKCDKRFSTQSQHATHQRDCGKEFFCTCGEKHNSVTALYMHAKRKQHDLPDQYNKRKKHEPVKETFIFIVPVPCGNPADLQRTMREPVPLLPHSSTCALIPISGTTHWISNITPNSRSIPATATMSSGTTAVGVGGMVKTESRASATTSTQTDESGVTPLPPKLASSSSYAQTDHSCFPSFIPMINGPRRHKKTLAVQTQANWTQSQLSGKMASTETQTMDGQGNTAQGQSSLGTQSAIPTRLPPLDQAVSGPLFPPFPNPVSMSVQQEASSNALRTLRPNSTEYNFGMNTARGSQSVPQNSQLDTNSTQRPMNAVAVSNSQSVDSTTPSMDPRNNMLTANEVLTQTDLTFQNFLEYNTSETQTLSNVNDAMTDTSEASSTKLVEARTGNATLGPCVPTTAAGMSSASFSLAAQTSSAEISLAPLALGVQTNATSRSPPPVGLSVQKISPNMSTEPMSIGVKSSAASVTPAPLSLGIQTSATGMTPAPLGLGAQPSATSMSQEPMCIGVQTNTIDITPAPLSLGVGTSATITGPAPLGHSVQTSSTNMSTEPMCIGVKSNAASVTPAPLSLGIQTSATGVTPAPLGLGAQPIATSMSQEPMCIGVQTNTIDITPAPLGLGVGTSATITSPAPLGRSVQTSSTNMSTEPMCIGVQSSAASVTPAPLSLGIQTSATGMTPAPLGLGAQTNATSMSPAPLDIGNQNNNVSMPPAPQGLGVETSDTSMASAQDIGMSGLDLLFLASTGHRSNSSLGLPRMDESACCQQTQTVFDTDTGHQETQTAWDWSLDEFSFLDQYTQTALSSSSSSSTGSTTTMPETDQFCQTGMDLYSQFAFSNTETQTVSVFDLEMFGNSISVQTEAGSGSKNPGEDGLSDIGKQVQASTTGSQQERVCADVQTEDMDFNRLRSRQMGSGQLASSHTQTSLWEDIESIIRSDSFTQTQFP